MLYEISYLNLALCFIPLILVGWIYWKWVGSSLPLAYGTFRMASQLLIVGMVLSYLFEFKSILLCTILLIFMITIAAWIALRPVAVKRLKLYGYALFSLATGCFLLLGWVLLLVIRITPWYEPRYLIPLAGMIFANAMNSVSLAAERFNSELVRGTEFKPARKMAFQTALLPITNSFFAAGIVSLPGMMTGQILSGISPLMAVRYQIVIMLTLISASAISSALFLKLVGNKIGTNEAC